MVNKSGSDGVLSLSKVKYALLNPAGVNIEVRKRQDGGK